MGVEHGWRARWPGVADAVWAGVREQASPIAGEPLPPQVVIAPEIAARVVERFRAGEGVGHFGRDLHLTPRELVEVLRATQAALRPVGAVSAGATCCAARAGEAHGERTDAGR
jgi:hypothetical protein